MNRNLALYCFSYMNIQSMNQHSNEINEANIRVSQQGVQQTQTKKKNPTNLVPKSHVNMANCLNDIQTQNK